jgi:NADH dehydrogenase [ubiquinone] 1 alpha subcomplex assembly factor 6
MTGSSDPKALPPKFDDVVFETATRANDHIISAQSIMKELKAELGGSLPDTVVLTAMGAIPTQLYLERLEKANFNLLDPRLSRSEWRLPWRSYRVYMKQAI